MKNRTCIFKLIPLFLLPLAFGLSLFLGAQKLNPGDIFIPNTVSNSIFFNLRLPRALLCIVAGAMLGGSGALFQMFFRNSLAEPGILGLSAGSTLGAVSFVCLLPAAGFAGLTLLNLGALAGAITSGIIIVLLAIGSRKDNQSVLLLCGVSLGTLYSALTSIILSLNGDRISTMYMWMLGSFSGRGWNELLFILPSAVIACILFVMVTDRLDLLCGGEDTAKALGVNISRLRVQILIGGSLAITAAVCAGGTIGFVGLVAPHVVRKVYGARARKLVPLSMFMGAVLLVLSDVLCRSIVPPRELPVGTITALMGVPFFISLLRKASYMKVRKRHETPSDSNVLPSSIYVSDVTFAYGDRTVLHGVSLAVKRGQMTVLTGPNGSGKSTLLGYLHGNCLERIGNPKERARMIAFMNQNETAIWNHGVRDFILTGRYCHTGFTGFYTRHDRMVTDKVIQWLQIGDLADKKIHQLSGGEFQKVRIARCLAQEPQFLLLDEPAANLDFGYQKDLMELLRRLAHERNIGICVTVHDINFAAFYADEMVLLPKGAGEITGSARDVMTRENLEATYGIPMEVYRHPVLDCPQAFVK